MPRAVVIGGSLGGLFIGNMLIRQGWAVDIYEQAEGPLGVRGAAVAGHEELAAILAATGADAVRPPAVDIAGRYAYDGAGTETGFVDHPQYMTYWRNVFALLRRAFPDANYHAGVALEELRRGPSGWGARLSTGERADADLIVAADGLRSRVRAQLAPAARPKYAGYFAFRGLVPEAGLSVEFRRAVFDRYVFVFPGEGQFCGLPLVGPGNETDRGQRQYAYLWYRRVEGAELDDLLTDADGVRHAESIPPPLIRPEHFQRLTALAARILPAPFDEAVARARGHVFQPIYELESERIVFDNVALIGDAAFVARPHVGIGVLKAGQDALALAQALERKADIDAALSDYAAARFTYGRNAVRLARSLGRFIERGLPAPELDGASGYNRTFILRVSGRPIEQVGLFLSEAQRQAIGWH